MAFSTPPPLPTQADAASGQNFRARLMDRIGQTQDAAYGYALRGGSAGSWPAQLRAAAAFSQVVQWRLPTWPAISAVSFGLRHAASLGTYGLRVAGAAAPAAVAFGAGDAGMLAGGIAYTRTSLAVTHNEANGYVDVDLFLNAAARLYGASMMLDSKASPLATGVYADGYKRWDTQNAAEAGGAALYHKAVDNLGVLGGLRNRWSAYAAPDPTNVAGYADPPPVIALPMWSPLDSQAARRVRVHVRLLPDIGKTARVDVHFGMPTPGQVTHRYGRFINSVSTAAVNGEWLTFTFPLRNDDRITPRLLGGLVNVDTRNNVVDGKLLGLSAWLE